MLFPAAPLRVKPNCPQPAVGVLPSVCPLMPRATWPGVGVGACGDERAIEEPPSRPLGDTPAGGVAPGVRAPTSPDL